MKQTIAKYPRLCGTVEHILFTFLTFYMVESKFCYVHYLLNKQKSTLNIECGDLQSKLTNLLPNIRDLLSAYQIHPFH